MRKFCSKTNVSTFCLDIIFQSSCTIKQLLKLFVSRSGSMIDNESLFPILVVYLWGSISVSLINEDTVEVDYATLLCNCIQLISCQNNDGTFRSKMFVYPKSKCGGILQKIDCLLT